MRALFASVLGLLLLIPAKAQSNSISLVTLNCHWFFNGEENALGETPLSKDEYSLKAGHLIGLLPPDAPLVIGLEEIGGNSDVEYLAQPTLATDAPTNLSSSRAGIRAHIRMSAHCWIPLAVGECTAEHREFQIWNKNYPSIWLCGSPMH